MISFHYKQKDNIVIVVGINSIDLSDIFMDAIIFEDEIEAYGYCLLINALESAVYSEYDGQCAIAIIEGFVDVTTESAVPPRAKTLIKQRIQQVLDLDPNLKGVRFYELELC